jgi:hypothetical protein
MFVRIDASRMTYHFTMMEGPHIIDCQISSVALDNLAGKRSQPPQVLKRDAQFLEFREQIEKLASDQFDRDIESKPKLVRIFAKHIPKGRHPGTWMPVCGCALAAPGASSRVEAGRGVATARTQRRPRDISRPCYPQCSRLPTRRQHGSAGLSPIESALRGICHGRLEN